MSLAFRENGQRVTYDVGGRQFTMRLIEPRDLIRVTGKLPILPVKDRGDERTVEQVTEYDYRDLILHRCSIMPKLILGDPATVLDGQFPINELPEAVYIELANRLYRDSGLSKEAADDIRPLPETATSS